MVASLCRSSTFSEVAVDWQSSWAQLNLIQERELVTTATASLPESNSKLEGLFHKQLCAPKLQFLLSIIRVLA